MTDLSPGPDAQPGASPDSDRPPARPRWVKVSLIIALVLVVAFVILQLLGVGGEHGPGRHIGPGGGSGPTSSTDITEHRPPAGVPNHGG